MRKTMFKKFYQLPSFGEENLMSQYDQVPSILYLLLENSSNTYGTRMIKGLNSQKLFIFIVIILQL